MTSVGTAAPSQTQPSLGRKTHQRGSADARVEGRGRQRRPVAIRRVLPEGRRDDLAAAEEAELGRAAHLGHDVRARRHVHRKVAASDGPSNGTTAAPSGELESASFTIDNTPPRIDFEGSRADGSTQAPRPSRSRMRSPRSSGSSTRSTPCAGARFPGRRNCRCPDGNLRVVLEEGLTPADITLRAFDALGNSVTTSANGPTAGVAAPRR